MKIDNRPELNEGFWKAHHLRHLITGTIVFCAGIIANEAVQYYKHITPVKVIYQTDLSTLQPTNHTLQSIKLIQTNCTLIVGFSDDGYVVWRAIKAK